jgi:hypothetical protein
MSSQASDRSLLDLLQHPAIWRGRSHAAFATLSTGYPALDDCLPGGGWPRAGLVEILTPRYGAGELRLLVPALAKLTQLAPPRWLAWIAPPFEPFAPALAQSGMALERQLVVRTETALWAMEQALGSGACDAALAWPRRAQVRSIRRLQIATERGRTLGFLFRELTSARESSPAGLRLMFEPQPRGARLTFLKSRGGARGSLDLPWIPEGNRGQA